MIQNDDVFTAFDLVSAPFKPNYKKIAQIPGIRDVEAIKEEPMIFSGDYRFSLRNGGSLTREILWALSETMDYDNAFLNAKREGLNILLDTRVTMTMPGDYPSRPGWHCDDVPRPNGQPALNERNPNVKFFQCNLATKANVSNTVYADEPLTLDVHYKDVWNSVDSQLKRKVFQQSSLMPGEIVMFDQYTLHRTARTAEAGWRLFFRLSFTHRQPANEVRKQVQIYTQAQPGW